MRIRLLCALDELRSRFPDDIPGVTGSMVDARPRRSQERLSSAVMAALDFFFAAAHRDFSRDFSADFHRHSEVVLSGGTDPAGVLARLAQLGDSSVDLQLESLIDNRGDGDAARSAIAGVFDDPEFDEVEVHLLGDGDILSGLLFAAGNEEHTAVLVMVQD